MRIIRIAQLLLPIILGFVAGCSGRATGKVTGRVLLDDKPLPGGNVYFRPLDGRAMLVTAKLDESGTFSVELPAGEVFVSVDNRDLAPKPPARPIVWAPRVQSIRDQAAKSAPPAPTPPSAPVHETSGRYIKIPERYYSAESSGLTFTVESGENPHDILLKSQ